MDVLCAERQCAGCERGSHPSWGLPKPGLWPCAELFQRASDNTPVSPLKGTHTPGIYHLTAPLPSSLIHLYSVTRGTHKVPACSQLLRLSVYTLSVNWLRATSAQRGLCTLLCHCQRRSLSCRLIGCEVTFPRLGS